MSESTTKLRLPEGCAPMAGSLRPMVPGGDWKRPYPLAPHVWEDAGGNRVIVNHTINYLTLRHADGRLAGLYDHEEPFASALKRHAKRRRAGLAAARRFFGENDEMTSPRPTPKDD